MTSNAAAFTGDARDALLREADLVLRTVEWRGSRSRGPRYCPQCDATAFEGHKPECPLDAVRTRLSRLLAPWVRP